MEPQAVVSCSPAQEMTLSDTEPDHEELVMIDGVPYTASLFIVDGNVQTPIASHSMHLIDSQLGSTTHQHHSQLDLSSL